MLYRHRPTQRVSIAVIEQDPAIRNLWRDLLTDEDYAPLLFGRTQRTYQGIRALAPATIILDVHPPGREWSVFASINADLTLRHSPLVLSSADDTACYDRPTSLQAQPLTVLPQPFDVDVVTALLYALTGGPARAADAATVRSRSSLVQGRSQTHRLT